MTRAAKVIPICITEVIEWGCIANHLPACSEHAMLSVKYRQELALCRMDRRARSGPRPTGSAARRPRKFQTNCSFQATFLLRGAGLAPRHRNDEGGVG